MIGSGGGAGVRAVLATLILALLIGGCGGATSGSGARLPTTRVEDLRGGTLPLSSLVPARRPILLWVWGPG